MATSSYPASKQIIPTYAGTALQGDIDHADWHDLTNKTVQAIEDVLGTTSGTSVLKNFTNGDFCARLTDIPNVPATTGTAINAGTANNEFATPKAIADSNIAFLSDIPSITTDGWTQDSDTWAYISASSFKITGKDVTLKFNTGTRLRFKQGGSYKYAVVISTSFSTDTTVNIAVNSDYIIANSTITDNYYSYQSCPQGYPDYFNWIPQWTYLTVGSATNVGKYSIFGNTLRFLVRLVFAANTTISNEFTLNLPITLGSGYGNIGVIGNATCLTGSTGYTMFFNKNGNIYALGHSGTFITAANSSATVPITWTTNDELEISASYKI